MINNDETRRASQDDSEPQSDALQSGANARADAENLENEDVSAPAPQETPPLSAAPATSKSDNDEAAHRDAAFVLRPAEGVVARDDRFAGVGLPSGVTPQEDDEVPQDDEDESVSDVLLTGEPSPHREPLADENIGGENAGSEYSPEENAAFSEDDFSRPEVSLADFASGELVSGAAPRGVQDALEAQDAVPSDNYDAAVFAAPAREYSPMSEAQSAPAPAPVTNDTSRDAELDVVAHLAELRARILRCVAAVAVAMIVTWQFRDQLLETFSQPMRAALQKHGGTLTTTGPTEGFAIYLQITFISAILLTIPILLWQIWAFVEPALTRQERRYGGLLVPFSVLLFVVGAALGFWMSPLFFEFFLQFQPPGTASFWTFADTAIFLAKMLLAFGITFQVPVITIFVNKIGLVSRNWLIEYWRHVVCVIFIVVAIVTPTWDPASLCAAAVPPCLLYGISIWLVKWL